MPVSAVTTDGALKSKDFASVYVGDQSPLRAASLTAMAAAA